MRMGKRSTRIRAGTGRQLIRLCTALLASGLAGAAFVATGQAERAAPARVGPARIFCNAAFCEMDSGARPKERIRVIVSNLPQEEIRRLRKCTGVGTPCIVIVDGTEQGDRMKIMASDIHWQE
ncbi:MAG: hypothetical protein M3Y22_15995 [Pseudomonadota bacterium]|nr:hypothetical protein [Pseudomonadota bacterium]